MENEEIRVKDYTVVSKLGVGSFGNVYLVKNKNNNKYYAAKTSQSSIDNISEFAREVNILSKITHPTILRFFGFSLSDFNGNQSPTYLIEYAENSCLHTILENERKGLAPTEWDDTKKYLNLFGIAFGMSFLHQNQIIHRDLKPQNVMEDEYLLPKIGDFGLSKICDIKQQSIQSIKCGTPFYMAPEIFTQQHYNYSVDVYAYSIILFEVLTGLEPYKEITNPFMIQNKVVNNNYRPKFPKGFNVTDSMKNLIEKCWSQEPKDRPTFSEIVEILKNDDFIDDSGFDVDKNDFLCYLDYLESQIVSFDETKNIENYIKNKKMSTIRKVPLPFAYQMVEYYKRKAVENVLSQIRMNYHEIANHICQLDLFLTEEQLFTLMRNLPTSSEIQKINDFGDFSYLGHCELFFYELSQIDNLQLHFNFLFLLQTFNARMEKITSNLKHYQLVLNTLLDQSFDQFLCATLKVINEESNINEFRDVKKEVYEKLKKARRDHQRFDFKNIIQTVINENPDSLSILDKFSSAEISLFYDIINDMDNIITTFTNCEKYMPKAMMLILDKHQYLFYQKFSEFSNDHYSEIISSQKLIFTIDEEYKKASALYGEVYDRNKIYYFIKIFSDFISSLKEAKKNIDEKDTYKSSSGNEFSFERLNDILYNGPVQLRNVSSPHDTADLDHSAAFAHFAKLKK